MMSRYGSDNERPRIISIVSGKGGTGKTLLTAVIGRALAREGLNVLLIDFDIFVRGLTILLADYLEKGLQTKTKITISDLLLHANAEKSGFFSLEDLAIFRFFECDVLPACNNIAASLDYDQKKLSDFEFGKSVFEKLLSIVGNKYDIILVDNRASIDSLVLAVCSCSDVVFSVAEDDDLCLQTNANLINHLRYRQNIESVYTVINKGRRKERLLTEFNQVGIIPFDIEIMEDFGKPRFWHAVYQTLFFWNAINAWNNLAKMEPLKGISLEKYRFPPSIFMSKREGRFTTVERMLRIYSLLSIIVGMLVLIFDKLALGRLSEVELTSFLLIAFGVLVLFLASSGIRRWLLGKSDEPKVPLSERFT